MIHKALRPQTENCLQQIPSLHLALILLSGKKPSVRQTADVHLIPFLGDLRRSNCLTRTSHGGPKMFLHLVSSHSTLCVSSQLSPADGGGIRGYYSLLILKLLMTMVKIFEQSFTDGNGVESPADSSFWPHNQPLHVSHTTLSGDSEHVSRNDYLPCHYFDTISGTSTGGYVQRPIQNLVD